MTRAWRYYAWACLLTACGGGGEDGPEAGSGGGGGGSGGGSAVDTDVGGSAQKGPFTAGSRITISELDDELVQTGRTFDTTLKDDKGSFSVRGVKLDTPFARVEVDGYYFDEVRGEVSDGRLSLFTYVDLSDTSTANINLLGHLEAARIEHLVVEQSLSFSDAKASAHQDVLDMFEIEGDVGAAETLDISQQGDANAKLLAISIMLQGNRSVGELTQLLSKLQTDLSEDGQLTDPDNATALAEGVNVDVEQARTNLEQRYAEVGVDASIPEVDSDLEQYAPKAPDADPGVAGAGGSDEPRAGSGGSGSEAGTGGSGSGGTAGTAGTGTGGTGGNIGDPSQGGTGAEEPACGNGKLDADEECDPGLEPSIACGDLQPGAIGVAHCEPKLCTWEQRDCRQCGNGTIDAGEQCDGDDFGGETCESLLPESSGPLLCTPECTIETHACEQPH